MAFYLFKFITMALVVVVFIGSFAVDLALGRAAMLAYVARGGRFLCEVVMAELVILLAWRGANKFIPPEYLTTVIAATPLVALLYCVFRVVRATNMFKDLEHMPGHHRLPDETDHNRQP